MNGSSFESSEPFGLSEKTLLGNLLRIHKGGQLRGYISVKPQLATNAFYISCIYLTFYIFTGQKFQSVTLSRAYYIHLQLVTTVMAAVLP